MKAYTDASVSSDGTVHSYIVYDDAGDVILQETLKSEIKNTVKAEMASVIALLIRCKDKAICNLSIHTDCQSVVAFDSKNKKVSYLRSWINNLLESTKASIKWINRKMNAVADKMCTVGRSNIDDLDGIDFQHVVGSLVDTPTIVKKTTIKKKNKKVKTVSVTNPLVYTKSLDKHLDKHLGRLRTIKKRVREGTTTEVYDTPIVFNEDDKEAIYTHYCRFVTKAYRYSIEDIIATANDKKMYQRTLVNNRMGRLVLVEKFIEKYHKTSHIDIRNTDSIPFKIYNPYPLQLN